MTFSLAIDKTSLSASKNDIQKDNIIKQIKNIINDFVDSNNQIFVVYPKKYINIKEAIKDLNNLNKFKEYTGIDLSSVDEIEKVTFSTWEDNYKCFWITIKILDEKKEKTLKRISYKIVDFKNKAWYASSSSKNENGVSIIQKLNNIFLKFGKRLNNDENIYVPIKNEKKNISIEKALLELKNIKKIKEYTGIDVSSTSGFIFSIKYDKYNEKIIVIFRVVELFKYHKTSFIITGLKTQLELEKNKVIAKIQALNDNKFNNIYNEDAKKKLASDDSNTSDEKKDAIVAMIQKEIINVPTKKLINRNLISFSTDIDGELKIIINLAPLGEPKRKIISISGFKNQLELNKNEVLKKVKELVADDFKKIFKNNDASWLSLDNSHTRDEKKDAIVAMIQKKINILSAKNLINRNLIKFDYSSKEALKIEIDLVPLDGSNKKIITILGLKNKIKKLNTSKKLNLSQKKSSSLSPGVISGIVIGVIVSIAGITFLVIKFLKLKKLK